MTRDELSLFEVKSFRRQLQVKIRFVLPSDLEQLPVSPVVCVLTQPLTSAGKAAWILATSLFPGALHRDRAWRLLIMASFAYQRSLSESLAGSRASLLSDW